MEKRYRALRIIGTIFRIMGIVVGVVTLLGVLLFLISSGSFIIISGVSREAAAAGMIFMALVLLISGLLAALVVYSVGELLYLLINIEENTRFTALMLRDRPLQQVTAPTAYSPPPVPQAGTNPLPPPQ